MRLQLRRGALAALLVVAVGGRARAQAPGAGAGSGSGSDEPSADDYRDVLDNPEPSPPDPDAGEPMTGSGRVGLYTDSDQTTVERALVTAAKALGDWTLAGTATVDAVTSASVDVRSSPALSAVDVITSASGISSTSGGKMSDTRVQLTGGPSWKDSDGHAAGLTAAFATERDYTSISGDASGSYDVLDRDLTLLGGVSVTDNWVSSVLDPSLHRKMFALGWSFGVAPVLTRDDALRVRYDGKASFGYLASPYRSVRFGDWMTTTNANGQYTFHDTIGPAGGLPETLPDRRISHALVVEWVHWLGDGVGLHPQLRVARDSWGIASVSPSLDLRIARPGWRLDVGYRFYAQSRARFFAGKYTMDPSAYTYYTSDKELGSELGHVGTIDVATVLVPASNPNDTRMMLDARLDVMRYSYPGFPLLASRLGALFELGLSWEL